MADATTLYGRGAQYPFTWDSATGGASKAEGVASVSASLRRLFDTTPGEDRFNPGYGCGLAALLFEQDSVTLRALLDTVIRDAVAKWEPRVAAVTTLNVVNDDADPATLHVQLAVRLIQSTTVYNLVFPFAVPS